MTARHGDSTGSPGRRVLTFQFWLTPIQAIGLAIFLMDLGISFAHADESRMKQPPPRATCIVCNARTRDKGEKRLVTEPSSSKLAELLAQVTEATRDDALAGPRAVVFRVEKLISSIELSTSGSVRHSVYLLPGMHWHAGDTARFGLGITCGTGDTERNPALLAAFTVQFK